MPADLPGTGPVDDVGHVADAAALSADEVDRRMGEIEALVQTPQQRSAADEAQKCADVLKEAIGLLERLKGSSDEGPQPALLRGRVDDAATTVAFSLTIFERYERAVRCGDDPVDEQPDRDA